MGNFAIVWTPSETGFYSVIAEFQGSNAYWPSNAETFVNVVAASGAAAETVAASLEIYILGAVVLVLVLMVVAILLLRKK